jgi:hypothetical protein
MCRHTHALRWEVKQSQTVHSMPINFTRVGAMGRGDLEFGRGGQCPCGMGAHRDKALGVLRSVALRISVCQSVCLTEWLSVCPAAPLSAVQASLTWELTPTRHRV